jgi:hypothetical protein
MAYYGRLNARLVTPSRIGIVDVPCWYAFLANPYEVATRQAFASPSQRPFMNNPG